MSFVYRSGFTSTFFANNNYVSSPPAQGNPQAFNMPFENSTSMQQANSPEAMMCSMKNMLQGVFTQFQQTAAAFQQFLSNGQGTGGCQQTQNISPEAQDIMNQLENVEPESPKAQQLQAKLSYLLPPDQAKSYFKNARQKQLYATTHSLLAYRSNLEPESPEAAQLDKRIQALQKLMQSNGSEGDDQTMMM